MVAFLCATLIPTAIFAGWSYQAGVQREFRDVEDRHLLLAQNLSRSLARYHKSVIATFNSISISLLNNEKPRNMAALLAGAELLHIALIDRNGKTIASAENQRINSPVRLDSEHIALARAFARSSKTRISNVMGSTTSGNVMLVVRRYKNITAIGVLSTRFISELGNTISFGKKGHAAIVDGVGNVLAHPLPSWVEARKNIAKVSAVQRMLNGEEGIERFYSPALKGDMIAGLTSVPGTGWGVMIPQPVSELYGRVYNNHIGIAIAIGLGMVLSFLLSAFFIHALASPLEAFLRTMVTSARNRVLTASHVKSGLITLKEMSQFNESYNRMVKRITAAHKRIESMAYTDAVTGLANRAQLQHWADEELSAEDGTIRSGAMVFLDFDNFKEINDLHGHAVGDEFLKVQSKRIVNFIESMGPAAKEGHNGTASTRLARLGGDEFVAMVPEFPSEAALTNFLDLLKKYLATPPREFAFITKTSVSIGAVRYPCDGSNLSDLLKKADIAMFQAKKDGKNGWHLYSPDTGLMSSAEFRQAITVALEEGQLRLEYQPKVDARTGSLKGVEALVRWHHPQFGEISPAKWIPALAGSTLMTDLGKWVAKQAMADQLNWTKEGHCFNVSVNIGATHFSSPGFAAWMKRAALAKGIDPTRFEVEITEDALFADGLDTQAVIRELQSSGFLVSIDDFGTGYSNIARLNNLPFDTIKLDRSVIVSARSTARGAVILKSIVAMADALECSTVAEGIETEDMAQMCRHAGIDQLQGYLFAKSMTLDALLQWEQARSGKTVVEMEQPQARSA